MLNDAHEDFMPRNAPIPTPLIEVAAVPSVPEVSLLFEADKTKTPDQHSPLNVSRVVNNGRRDNDCTLKRNQGAATLPVALMRNQHESYNTWRVRNAQALQIITGSAAGNIESHFKPTRTDMNGSGWKERRQADDLNRQSVRPVERLTETVSERYEAQGPPEKYSSGVPRRHEAQAQTKRYSPSNLQRYEDHVPVERYSSGVPRRHEAMVQVERSPSGAPQRREPRTLQNNHEYETSGESRFIPDGPNLNKIHLNDLLPLDHIKDEIKKWMDEYKVELRLDGNQNRGQFEDRPSENLQNRVRSDPRPEEGGRGCEPRGCCAQPVHACQHTPALSGPSVSERQIADLYNVIHLQNEQILLLQQQVKQVLQIHLDCDASAERRRRHECPCEKKEASRAETKSVEAAAEAKTAITKSPSGLRSVGVMTSMAAVVGVPKNMVGGTPRNVVGMSKNGPVAPTRSKREARSRPAPEPRKGRRKSTAPAGFGQVFPEEGDGRPEVDDSFSLDEARLALRLRPRAEAPSPDTSVHVDLQDYCSSSGSGSESYDSDETEVEEERGSESGNEERPETESSEPQLGWTFYNHVVGQVNNILKKPERRRSHGRSAKQHEWGEGVGEDTFDDNNWSKRVTFNGGSPEVKSNNYRGHQAHRPNGQGAGGGGGAPDHLLMYNTNLSFSTLGYLQRYNLLPENLVKAYNLKPNGQVKPSQKNQRRSRRNHTTAASSKLLDVTALKRQPKLF